MQDIAEYIELEEEEVYIDPISDTLYRICFQSHADAQRAHDKLLSSGILNILGAGAFFTKLPEIYGFSQETMRRRIGLTIENLPPHLHSETIIEHICNSFCAVDFVPSFAATNNITLQTDLTSLKCIAWCDADAPIPKKMNLKIVSPVCRVTSSRQVMVYAISFKVTDHIYGLQDDYPSSAYLRA